MIDAIGGPIEEGRVKVYAVDSFDSGSWYREGLSLEERAQQHGRYEDWILNQVVPFIQDDSKTAEIMVTGVSFGAYHAANFALRHAHVFPLAICQSGVYDVSVVAGGAARRRRLLQQPGRLRPPPRRRPPRLAPRPRQPAPDRRPGPVGGHDRRAREHAALRGAARREGNPARARPLGPRLAARLARVARPDRASSPPLPVSSRTHLIGLLLGTEEDWPRAFEHLLAQVGPIEHGGDDARADDRADHERAVRPALEAALLARDRPARLVVHRPARVAEEGLADGRRLPAEQPVHVPGDGEALRLLRDDAARAERAGDVADPAQEPAREPALRADRRALQPPLRPRGDRGARSATRST